MFPALGCAQGEPELGMRLLHAGMWVRLGWRVGWHFNIDRMEMQSFKIIYLNQGWAVVPKAFSSEICKCESWAVTILQDCCMHMCVLMLWCVVCGDCWFSSTTNTGLKFGSLTTFQLNLLSLSAFAYASDLFLPCTVLASVSLPLLYTVSFHLCCCELREGAES